MLNQLRRQIIEELCIKKWRDAYFFPEHDGVKGWRGNARIMFVGLNPSMGTFPSKADVMLYKTLSRHGLGNAHLTDLMKIRLSGSHVAESFAIPELVDIHKAYLAKEVRILRPHTIVAFGKKTFDLLQEWLPGEFRPRVVQVHHYSWAHRYGKRDVFVRDMNRIKKRFDELERAGS